MKRLYVMYWIPITLWSREKTYLRQKEVGAACTPWP
jgi:hypothetical protein